MGLALVTIAGGGQLIPAAAQDWGYLAAEFEDHFHKPLSYGSTIRYTGSPTDAPSQAVAASQWAHYSWYLLHGWPVAAYPGRSYHEKGQAVDVWAGVDSFGTPEHDWLVANGPRFGWYWGDSPVEPWHFVHYSLITIYTPPAKPAPPQEDEMSAAEIADLKKVITDGLGAAVKQLQSFVAQAVTREGRPRIYFDSGTDGKTSYDQATRVALVKVETGYIYPLNSDPAGRASQLASLRQTPYLLIGLGEGDHPNGLPTAQFDNLIEAANGQLRRIAAEVIRQQTAGAAAVTPATTPAGTTPTPVLK